MIDIHSHILYGIDDGSKSLSMTLEMIKNAEKDGTSKLVATPHYCRGYGETEYCEVKNMLCNLKEIVKKEKINVELFHGQEVYYEKNILEFYDEGLIGTINDTMYMLIELPMNKFDSEPLDVIYELRIKGIVPILAHPERYIPFIKEPSKINDFIKEGFLFQVNSGSLTGQFGKQVKKTAQIFIDNNIYNFMGSDAHNDNNRVTGLSRAMKCVENKKLFEESSNKLLKNEEIKFIGECVKKKSKFFSLFN